MAQETQNDKDKKLMSYLINNGDLPDLISTIIKERANNKRPIAKEVLADAFKLATQKGRTETVLAIYNILEEEKKMSIADSMKNGLENSAKSTTYVPTTKHHNTGHSL